MSDRSIEALAGGEARRRPAGTLLARRITRVALGLLLGLKCGLPGGLFFLFAGDPGGLGGGGFSFEALLFGLGRFLGFSRLGAGGGLGFALGLTALHFGIVGSRLGAKLVQDVLPGLQRGLLAIRKARFLESAHKKGLVAFTLGVERAWGAEWRLSK